MIVSTSEALKCANRKSPLAGTPFSLRRSAGRMSRSRRATGSTSPPVITGNHRIHQHQGESDDFNRKKQQMNFVRKLCRRSTSCSLHGRPPNQAVLVDQHWNFDRFSSPRSEAANRGLAVTLPKIHSRNGSSKWGFFAQAGLRISSEPNL